MSLQSIYGVHPAIDYNIQIIANAEKRTGRTLDAWAELVNTEGPDDDSERRDWLKSVHGLGTNYAWFVVELSRNRGQDLYQADAYMASAAQCVEEMYSGAKAPLRLIYEALLSVCAELGTSVKACPCKTIVPIYRNHVIAQIKPTTRTRIDFGFALKDRQCTGNLLSTGGFAKGDRISHRLPVSSMDDITEELRSLLREAYDLDA